MRTLTVLMMALSLTACEAEVDDGEDSGGAGEDDTETTGEDITASDVQPIFDDNCVSCHNAQDFTGTGSDFSDISTMVGNELSGGGGDYVVAGDPSSSAIVDRISRTGGTAGAMPQGGPALDQADIDAIVGWINGGAQ